MKLLSATMAEYVPKLFAPKKKYNGIIITFDT